MVTVAAETTAVAGALHSFFSVISVSKLVSEPTTLLCPAHLVVGDPDALAASQAENGVAARRQQDGSCPLHAHHAQLVIILGTAANGWGPEG